ncbi:hypothetical protein JCM10908_002387 [Rhodotorula pacifica]|uniref:uncharacterized protein n=1 Tax=Rhodotorula pacifica TaxID=1495444 RepID=UPI00317F55EB
MSTERMRTSLLSLPDELLEVILTTVLAGRPRSPASQLALICRRMARLVRQPLYYEITLRLSSRKCRKLHKLLMERADLRELVKDVTLYDIDDDGIPSIALSECAELVAKLPQLDTLSLEAVSSVIAKLFDEIFAQGQLSARHVSISLFPDNDDPEDAVHDAVWWPSLARLPRLRQISLYPGDDANVTLRFPAATTPLPLTAVRKLDIYGTVFSAKGPADLADLLPHLERLDLTFHNNAEGLVRSLQAAPGTLTHLHIYTSCAADAQILPILNRFPHLDHLSIPNNLQLRLLLPFLLSSRIRLLSFHHDLSAEHEGVNVTDEFLLKLVSAAEGMQCLKRLQIDYAWARHDVHVQEEIANAIRTAARDDLDWTRARRGPHWPAGCSAKGLESVIEVARTRGIHISGDTLHCLDWHRHFDDLVERCLVDHALAENDYTLIEQYLGEEGAGAAILHQRPRLAELVAKGRA